MSPLLILAHDTAKEVGIILREITFLKKYCFNQPFNVGKQQFLLHERLTYLEQAARDINKVVDSYYTSNRS